MHKSDKEIINILNDIIDGNITYPTKKLSSIRDRFEYLAEREKVLNDVIIAYSPLRLAVTKLELALEGE